MPSFSFLLRTWNSGLVARLRSLPCDSGRPSSGAKPEIDFIRVHVKRDAHKAPLDSNDAT